MGILKEMNDSLREKDPFEIAMEDCGMKHENEEEGVPCKDFMDPARIGDFAKAIAKMMKDGSSYGDAKAEAFDETKVPPKGSPCCKAIRTKVDQLLSK